jgi:predicted MFS family arabinose efflux permease
MYGVIIMGALSISIRDGLLIPFFSDMLLDRASNE